MIKIELQETMGNDRRIAEAAWTSSSTLESKELKTDADVKRVVNMLADHGHATPFESVILRFWIKLPIAIDRQHMTHRIASHNGMSGRYRTMPSEWLNVPNDINEIIEKAGLDSKYNTEQYNQLCKDANDWYRNCLFHFKLAETDKAITNKEYKRLREFFRGVLPQHNMTERVTIMNLRSFANYQKLRNHSEAQDEIHQIAQLMLECVEKSNVCPIALEALKKNNWEI